MQREKRVCEPGRPAEPGSGHLLRPVGVRWKLTHLLFLQMTPWPFIAEITGLLYHTPIWPLGGRRPQTLSEKTHGKCDFQQTCFYHLCLDSLLHSTFFCSVAVCTGKIFWQTCFGFSKRVFLPSLTGMKQQFKLAAKPRLWKRAKMFL